jgi:site-specific DNA recombinase
MAQRAVGYIRVSTDKQAELGMSLEAQRAKLDAYTTLYDLELRGVEVDAGESAKSLKRPGLQRALKALKEGQAEALVVVKLDRLTRRVCDLGTLIDEYFGPYQLMSVSEQVDTRTAAGRMVLNMLMTVAQWERETIGERTKDAMRYQKSQGKAFGPGCYKDADIAAYLKAEHARGRSFRELAAELNSRGIPTAQGGASWYASSVRSVVLHAA